MKKFFAMILCLAMVLAMAACGGNSAPAGTPTDDLASTPEAAGVLFLSTGAEFRVIFDTEGLVIAVNSSNESAAEILLDYPEAIGRPCDNVVSNLITLTASSGLHLATRVIVIKEAPGSKVPSASFLESVRVDAAAATDYDVVLITADQLTADGYITADAAKDILTRQLKLTDVQIACSEVVDDLYTLTYEENGAEMEYKIRAVTGTVILENPSSTGDAPAFDEAGNLIEEEPDFIVDYPEEEEPGFNPDAENL